jgi:SAM-dependent methyltransferase
MLRRWTLFLRRTPFHPQWHLGGVHRFGPWIRENAAGRVLDVGCADSWIRDWLASECDYVGLDYPATGQGLYRARPDVFADASQIPIVDCSIDTVVVLEVMEHLRDPGNAFQEFARVLKPDGRILLSVPFLYPIHDAPHDYQRMTLYGLRRDLDAAGFEVECISRTLGSAETAGLIACLAIGGAAVRAVDRRSPGLLILPLVVLLIPVINLLSWLGGRILPAWDAITEGYRVSARRRSQFPAADRAQNVRPNEADPE